MAGTFQKITVLITISFVLGFASLGFGQAGSRISCMVLDSDDKPIKDALITVTATERPSLLVNKKTNKRGRCSISVADGTLMYTFKVEKEGYQSMMSRIKPAVGGTVDRVFRLVPPGAGASAAVPTREQVARQNIASKKVRLYNEGAEAQKAGDLVGAMAKFKEALEEDPDFAPAYTGMVVVYLEQKNYTEAAAAAEKAVALAPEDFRALHLRFDAYRKLGNKEKADEAAKALKAAGDIKEAAARIYNEGIDAYKKGDIDTAKSNFLQVIELDPELVRGYGNLARIYMKEGNWDMAVKMADQVLTRTPDDTTAMKIRYDALQNMGDLAGAKEALRKVIAADPEWAATGLYEHARAFFNANRIEDAEIALEELLASNTDHAEAHYLLGLCNNSVGDTATAKIHLSKFVELAPEHPDVQVAKEILKYIQ